MKILLLPADERPCNYLYPNLLPLKDGDELILPPKDLMSKFKRPCNLKKLSEWLLEKSRDVDYLIVSLDTLLFGGMIPSRLHHDSLDDIKKRSDVLKIIRKNNPKIKIYAFELIMRCPSYSLADEEPDYYDRCGLEIFKYGQLVDKKEQGINDENDLIEENKLKKIIGENTLKDYISRREINFNAIIYNLNLLKEKVVDYFLIPQDDCNKLGFTNIDKRKVYEYLKENDIDKNIDMFPGGDEIGLLLIGRAINDYNKKNLKFYIKYACKIGKNKIPPFEDKPIDETLTKHINSTLSIRTNDEAKADIVLYVNLGSDFYNKWENMYTKAYIIDRDLDKFVENIESDVKKNLIVGIADVAFCNEAESLLIKKLNDKNLLLKIKGFSGWNTSSNTIGTVLGSLISYFYSKNEQRNKYFLIHRYVEDYIYMGIVRNEIINIIENSNIQGLSRRDLTLKKDELEKQCNTLMYDYLKDKLINIYSLIKELNCKFIWNRTFEIELTFKTKG